jgi:hypothetical protein
MKVCTTLTLQKSKRLSQHQVQDLNEEQFSPQKARELYAKLVDQVMTAIRMARNKGEAAVDEALARLYAIIDRSLVCMSRCLLSDTGTNLFRRQACRETIKYVKLHGGTCKNSSTKNTAHH